MTVFSYDHESPDATVYIVTEVRRLVDFFCLNIPASLCRLLFEVSGGKQYGETSICPVRKNVVLSSLGLWDAYKE